MRSQAVILERPGKLALGDLAITDPSEEDIVVEVEASGISTGTERLLWSGRMPDFPGLAYPLVPGYESVGIVVDARPSSGRKVGDRVFVPGANCYGKVRGLFGGASSRIVVPGRRTQRIGALDGEEATLLALAATGWHAVSPDHRRPPELIVGHGALGRLIARIVVATGGKPPTVWETDPARRTGATEYRVIAPEEDERRDYRRICDVSGDAGIFDKLVSRIARGGEIVLAGFYEHPISFAFPPAFMREAQFRIAAEWQPSDLSSVTAAIEDGNLSLSGLITHRETPANVDSAYERAFTDPNCLKMVLDWRHAA